MLPKIFKGSTMKALVVLFLIAGIALAAPSITIKNPSKDEVINEGEPIYVKTTAERSGWFGKIDKVELEIRDLQGNIVKIVEPITNTTGNGASYSSGQWKKKTVETSMFLNYDVSPGIYKVRVWAKEEQKGWSGTNTKTVRFEYNGRPTASIDFDEPGTVNKEVELRATGYDGQGDSLEYEWDVDDDNKFEYRGKTIHPTFSTPGMHKIKLRVTDEHGARTVVGDSIQIVSGQKPVAAISADKITSMEPPLTVNFDATGSHDREGDIVNYKWDFDNDGTWDYSGANADKVTHIYYDKGIYEAVVQVEDEEGNTATNTQMIIIDYSRNHAPEITTGKVTTEDPEEEETIVIYADAYDQDGDTIPIYQWDFNDRDGVNWNSPDREGSAQTVTWSYDEADTYLISVRAIDGRGVASTAGTIEVNVKENEKPSIRKVVGPKVTVKEGEDFRFYMRAKDEDGYINGKEGAYKWDFDNDGIWDYSSRWSGYAVHNYDNDGIYVALAQVTDDDGESDEYSVTVEVKNQNNEPELTNGKVTPDADNEDNVTFSVDYKDIDNEEGTVEVYYKHETGDWEDEGDVDIYRMYATCNDYTDWCTYTGEVGNLNPGTYEYYFTADDGEVAITYPAQGIKTFTVNAGNEAPDVDLLNPSSGETGIDDDAKLEVNVVDPENDDVTVKFYEYGTNYLIGSDQVSGEGEARVEWDDLEENKTYKWYVEADDGENTVISPTWTFKTEGEQEIGTAPIADAGQDITAEANEKVTFEGEGYDEDGQVVRYRWDFDNDGDWDHESTTTGTTTHTYTQTGTYTAKLQVKDDEGYVDTDTVKVKITTEGGKPNTSITENVEYGTAGDVKVTGKYSYDVDLDRTEMIVKFENRAGEEENYTVTMMIPKTIAETTQDITIFPSPDAVILEDPTVAWNVSLAPLETFQVVLRKDGYIEPSEFDHIETDTRKIETTAEDEEEQEGTRGTGLILGALANPAIGLTVLIALIVLSFVVWKREDIRARLRENLKKN